MLLALDLGQTVGWAAGASGKPDYGSFKIAPPVGMDFGRSLASAADQVAALIVRYRAPVVYIEAPAPLAAFTNNPGMLQTRGEDVALQFALMGVVQLVCFRRSIRCELGNVNRVRTHFLKGIPKRHPDGSKIKPKARVNLACVKRGWITGDDHAADACALWAYALDAEAKMGKAPWRAKP